MIRFNNDYHHGAHPQILEALTNTNTENYCGYGLDPWCEKAVAEIKKYLDCPNAAVHFFVGATQAPKLPLKQNYTAQAVFRSISPNPSWCIFPILQSTVRSTQSRS